MLITFQLCIIFHLYRALVINYFPKLNSTININARARVNNANVHYMTTPGLDGENEVIGCLPKFSLERFRTV